MGKSIDMSVFIIRCFMIKNIIKAIAVLLLSGCATYGNLSEAKQFWLVSNIDGARILYHCVLDTNNAPICRKANIEGYKPNKTWEEFEKQL